MKTFKRNAVIIVVALFVVVAAYLNWSYSRAPDTETLNPAVSPDINTSTPTPSETDNNIGGDNNNSNAEKSGLFYEGSVDQAGQFAEMRLNRQQARDAAVATLATVNDAEGASQDVLDSALSQIMEIAAFSQREVELETLIKAKGFSDCVVFLSTDGVKVTVPAPQAGLSAVDVAKITDVIVSDTDFTAEQLSVVEVK